MTNPFRPELWAPVAGFEFTEGQELRALGVNFAVLVRLAHVHQQGAACFGVGPGRLQAHPFRRQRGTDRQSHGHTQSNGQAQKGTANQRGHEEFSA